MAGNPYDTDLDKNRANYVPLSPLGFIERSAAVSLIATHGASAFCRALYNANEFVYVP